MTNVPDEGMFLVIDGQVHRFEFDTVEYAGPQVHLIITPDGPIEIEDK